MIGEFNTDIMFKVEDLRKVLKEREKKLVFNFNTRKFYLLLSDI